MCMMDTNIVLLIFAQHLCIIYASEVAVEGRRTKEYSNRMEKSSGQSCENENKGTWKKVRS